MLVPPYGAAEAGLETIFDVKHLEKKSCFLDTQCNQSFFSQPTLLLFFPQTAFPYPWEVLFRRKFMVEGCSRSTRSRIILA